MICKIYLIFMLFDFIMVDCEFVTKTKLSQPANEIVKENNVYIPIEAFFICLIQLPHYSPDHSPWVGLNGSGATPPARSAGVRRWFEI